MPVCKLCPTLQLLFLPLRGALPHREPCSPAKALSAMPWQPQPCLRLPPGAPIGSNLAAFQSLPLLQALHAERAASAGPTEGNEEEAETETEMPLRYISLYKFASLPDYQQLRGKIRDFCDQHHLSGGIILAEEGINGSICGKPEDVSALLEFLRSDPRLQSLRHIEAAGPAKRVSTADSAGARVKATPFQKDRVKVKLKREVVPMGVEGVDPNKVVGTYVKPNEWNKLLEDPDVVVVDVRNEYETRIGRFKGAVDPKTESFRDFPTWAAENLPSTSTSSDQGGSDGSGPSEEEGQKQPKKVAMYCTGGIRCEKASSYLLQQGIDEVYHLEGGILKYLEETPPSESLWEGECFVFDRRVAVRHGLEPGSYTMCYSCKQPVSDEDLQSPLFEEGVSCPYCAGTRSEKEVERLRLRQMQFDRYGSLGGPVPKVSARRQRTERLGRWVADADHSS